MPDDLNVLPVSNISPVPADQHSQLMYALGQITAELKGLKDGKILQNGRVEKLEIRMKDTELWQSASDGKEKGLSGTWLLGLNILTAVGVIVSIYFALRK